MIHYETLFQEVLALWPDRIEWQKSEDPLAARYVVAFLGVYDAIDSLIEKSTDEIYREFQGIMNWAISVGFHWVLVDEQIEQQGKVSGVLHKSDLPLAKVKRKFIENLADELWVNYMQEHNIVITGLD